MDDFVGVTGQNEMSAPIHLDRCEDSTYSPSDAGELIMKQIKLQILPMNGFM